MSIIFETKRFAIRQYHLKDVNQFTALLTDPEVRLYLPQRSRDEWANIFTANLEFYKHYPALGRWGVEDKASGKLMANCMLLPGREGLPGFEIGYSIEKLFWGTGAGTEIATGLVKYTFETAGADLIYAITTPENIASRRVLEKSGFTYNGLIPFLGMQLSYYEIAR